MKIVYILIFHIHVINRHMILWKLNTQHQDVTMKII